MMKQIYVKISRVCLGFACIAIAILVGVALILKTQEIKFPTAVGIFIILSIILTGVCLVIATCLDIVENVKRNGFSFVFSYLAMIVVLWLALVAVEYCLDKQKLDVIKSLIQAAASVCGLRAGNYILSKKN